MKRQLSDYRARAEQALGRPLTRLEHVHHHSSTQLVICSQAYHMWLHERMRAKGVKTDKPINFIIRDVPDDFWRQFKSRAALEGLTLKKAVFAAIKLWMLTGRTGEV